MNFLKHHDKSSSVVVHDLDIMGVTVREPKNQPPWPVDGQRPTARSTPGQFVQTETVQPTKPIEALRAVERLQPLHGSIDIHAGPSALPGFGKAPRAGVSP
jgi:hypothetical protein